MGINVLIDGKSYKGVETITVGGKTLALSYVADGGTGDSGNTEATLTGISATYTGGDVATGTAVTALKGITVKAHYSDGTTKTVTGYTLSGEILEGTNTITVSYEGKKTTFTVTGVSTGGDVTAELIEDGLVGFFDLRNIDKTKVDTASLTGGGYGLPTATKGSASLFAWGAWCNTTDEYGTEISRGLTLGNENGTTGKTFTGDYTFVGFGYGTGFVNSGIGTHSNAISLDPKYKDTSGNAVNVGAERFDHPLSSYSMFVQRISGNKFDVFVNESKIHTYDGAEYDSFASWVIANNVIVHPYQNNSKITAVAVYDRALTDVEIVETYAYLKTLEVV